GGGVKSTSVRPQALKSPNSSDTTTTTPGKRITPFIHIPPCGKGKPACRASDARRRTIPASLLYCRALFQKKGRGSEIESGADGEIEVEIGIRREIQHRNEFAEQVDRRLREVIGDAQRDTQSDQGVIVVATAAIAPAGLDPAAKSVIN